MVQIPALANKAAGQGSRRAGGEAAVKVPDALIGSWALNLRKSRYAGQPSKGQTRTFDYAENGKVLCTYSTTRASGAGSFGHWLATFDGRPYPNFLRSSGAAPYSVIAHTRVDDYTIEIVNEKDGRVLQKGSYVISRDGRTLTQTLTAVDANGHDTTNVAVFDKTR